MTSQQISKNCQEKDTLCCFENYSDLSEKKLLWIEKKKISLEQFIRTVNGFETEYFLNLPEFRSTDLRNWNNPNAGI